MHFWQQLRTENRLRAPHYPGPSPQVRHPRWSFTEVAEKRNASLFHRLMWNTMSLIFPEGERFFIRSVRRFAEQIDNPTLQKEVKAFIAQEVQHGRMHELFNLNAITNRYQVEGFLALVNTTAYGWLETFSNAIEPKFALAITAAAEHFTASWGRTALLSERVKNISSKDLQELILWHALEELEHKHVAFDVLRMVDDSYSLRIAGMLVTTFLLSFYLTVGFLWFLAQEKNIDFPALLLDLLHDILDKEGITNRFLVSFFSYFRPGYHPRDEDDSELIEQAQQRLSKASFLVEQTA